MHIPKLIKLLCLLSLLGLLAAGSAEAVPGTPGTNNPWMDYWDFADNTNWTTYLNYTPISFTNVSTAPAGPGNALVVDSTNSSWLNYNVNEYNGWTNLTVDTGSFQMWVNPNWSSTNQGGAGPGNWGRLIEVGSYTTNASVGWWSLYTDPAGANLYFSAQTNNGVGTNYLTAPVSFASNQWHLLALTYSPTNTALYIDGVLATNGPGMTMWPGPDVLANGFWIGSDSNGVNQIHGALSQLTTYSYVLDTNTIYANYFLGELLYGLAVFDGTNLVSAPSTPAYLNSFDAITGPGYLQPNGPIACVTNSNVWLTNVSAMLTNGAIRLSFGIAGGSNGVPYDVFATTALTGNYPSNSQWAWMGQGYHCTSYSIPGLPTNSPCFLILGTPRDDDGDGLTTTYELLVSKTNPYSPDTYGGIPDAWLAMHGYGGIIRHPAALDPDGDGLTNLQEYLWGTDPQVSEGFSIWVASPAGAAGIP